jgi:phenylpropionate dioxygenase-like ring-hydroxylating dioxygenase large terminal subunit
MPSHGTPTMGIFLEMTITFENSDCFAGGALSPRLGTVRVHQQICRLISKGGARTTTTGSTAASTDLGGLPLRFSTVISGGDLCKLMSSRSWRRLGARCCPVAKRLQAGRGSKNANASPTPRGNTSSVRQSVRIEQRNLVTKLRRPWPETRMR